MADSVSAIISLVTTSIKTWKLIDKAINSLKNAPANIQHWKTTAKLLEASCLQIRAVVERKQHSTLTRHDAKFCEAVTAHMADFEGNSVELLRRIEGTNPPGQAGKRPIIRFRDRPIIAIWKEISMDKGLCARVDRNIHLISLVVSGLSLMEPGPEDKIHKFVDLFERLPLKHLEEGTSDDGLVEDLERASMLIATRAALHDISNSEDTQEVVDQPEGVEIPGNVSLEELSWRLHTALGIAERLFDAGLFIIAAKFQRDAIKFATELEKAGGVQSEATNRVSLEDKYVTILKSCRRFDEESRNATLSRLDELASAVGDMSNQPCTFDICRQHHNIGALYAKLRETEKAIRCLRLALDGYLKMDPAEYHDRIKETLKLVAQQHEDQEEFTESKAIKHMVLSKLAKNPNPNPAVLFKTIDWCTEKGFSVKAENEQVIFQQLTNSSDNTPLHEAALDAEIDAEILPHLMKCEFYQVEDQNKDTPLLVAAEKANIKVLEVLLPISCLVHVRDRRRQTPLHRCQDPKALDLLIQAVNQQNSTVVRPEAELITINTMAGRETALHLACRRGRVEVVEALISGGADVNASCHLKQTPLMVACMASISAQKRDQIIRLLIHHNAAEESLDVQNKNARAYLKQNGYRDSDASRLFAQDRHRPSWDSGIGSITTIDGPALVQTESSSSEQGAVRRSSLSRFSLRFGRTFSRDE